MKINLLIITGLFCIIKFSVAQQITGDEKDIFSVLSEEAQGNGLVYIYQDYRIEKIVLQHIERNKKINGIPGYRIRIFSESGLKARSNWIAAKDTFDKYYFPEVRSYQEYVSPNYLIYVGDFRSKVEAEQFLKKIRRDFPRAFTVPARINYPKIELSVDKN